MALIEVVLTGTLPLLVHSQEAMNRSRDDARKLALLNKKRNKQDSDYEEISDLEMKLGVYWSSDPKRDCAILPAFNVIRSIQDGGKKLKLGRRIIEGLRLHPLAMEPEILYGPKLSFDQFVLSPQHRDVRTVRVSGTVSRTRPIFRQWSLKSLFVRIEEILSLDEVKECGRSGGLYYGIGDFRVGTKNGGQYGTYDFECRDLTPKEAALWQ